MTAGAAPHRMVIVTGASRGIGAAVARLAASRGFAVAVNYSSSPEAAAEVVRDIERDGGRAVAIHADIGREAEVVRLFDEAEAALGPVTALVNNAGITGRSGLFADLPTATLEEVMRLNVVGTALCAREAVRRMSTSRDAGRAGASGPGRGGAIVNLSSVAAAMGSPGEYVHYAASKGAVESLTIGLGKEVAREGIRVNAVAPGLIDTGIHAASGDPGRVARIVPTVPMGRIGTTEEVAEAVLYLLSDAAAYVTATVLRVTGGR